MRRASARAAFWLLAAWLLSGCSPHPGSGNWLARGNNNDGFSQLQVHFDGKAELHYADDMRGELHCFWQAMNKDTLDMICSLAGDEDTRLSFQLRAVDESRGELRRDGELVGRFDRQPLQ